MVSTFFVILHLLLSMRRFIEGLDMRRNTIIITILITLWVVSFSTTGCRNTRPSDDLEASADSTVTDSVAEEEEDSLSDIPMPKAADELFDDFIFNFAANKKLQKSRIAFPLPVFDDKKVIRKIERGHWKMENFFMRQGYYTLLFNDIEQLEVVKDTTINHVVIEKISLEKGDVNQYVFDRLSGQWMLTSIHNITIKESSNKSFLEFYQRFSSDEEFQIESMSDFVTFTAPDPDDDFNSITGSMVPEQWPAFKPSLIPEGTIYNIIYGNPETEETEKENDEIIFLIRGIANGMESEMTFKKKGEHWKLMKFNS